MGLFLPIIQLIMIIIIVKSIRDEQSHFLIAIVFCWAAVIRCIYV